MSKEKYVGLAVLTLILTAGISPVFAGTEDWGGAKKGFSEKHQVQMFEIFENGSYEDWADFVKRRFEERTNLREERHNQRVGQVTKENFENFAKAHALKEAGDFDGARAVAKEAGIERGFGFMQDGFQGGRGGGQRFSQDQ